MKSCRFFCFIFSILSPFTLQFAQAEAPTAPAVVKEQTHFAPLYELRQDAVRIGYLQFLKNDAVNKKPLVNDIREVFGTTSIEETSNKDLTTYTGIKYYFGYKGEPQIMILLAGTNLKDQEDRAIRLAKKVNFELVYRGNLMLQYWTAQSNTSDLMQAKDANLNIYLNNQNVSFANVGENWVHFKGTRHLQTMYRGQPGEIIYLKQTVAKDAGKSEAKQAYFNFVKSKTVASVPAFNDPKEPLENLFSKSDADCVFNDNLKSLVYCASSQKPLDSSVAIRRWMDDTQAVRNQLSYEYESGHAKMTIPANRAEFIFDGLIERTNPVFAYSGSKNAVYRNYKIAGITDSKSIASTDLKDSAQTKDFRVDLYNKSNEKIASVRFWGVNEVDRSRIVQFLIENLTPDHYQYVQIQSPSETRGVASEQDTEKLVGIYYEKDKSWVDRNRARYFNKDYVYSRVGLNQYDYKSNFNSNLAYLNRGATSVSSYVDVAGDWWVTQSFWGIHGQGRYARLSHSVNNEAQTGQVYRMELGPKLRYFFSQSQYASGFEFFAGYQQDADMVTSNPVMGSLSMNLLPLELKFVTFITPRWKTNVAYRHSFILDGKVDFAGAGKTTLSGSADLYEAELLYNLPESSFDLRVAAQYQATDFELNNTSGTREEFGGSFGIVRRWN